MMKLLIATACFFTLTATGATAGPRDKQSKQQNQQPNITTGAAGDQKLFGGNPDAGGGSRGNAQATNNPNASKEIGTGP